MIRIYDIPELMRRAGGRIEEVLRSLYPGTAFKREGSNLVLGDIEGNEGRTFNISIKPGKVGLYTDRADPSVKGDLITLVCHRLNKNRREGIEWLADFVCLQPTEQFEPRKKQPLKDGMTSELHPLNDRAVAYCERRGISRDTLEAARVHSSGSGAEILFPHYNEEEQLAFIQYRRPGAGKTHPWTTENPYFTLFGKHLVDPNRTQGTLVITEGHWDALSWVEIGVPAVSIPTGAENHAWIANDYHWLNQFTTIVLNYDNDEVGIRACDEAMRRLGPDRCKILRLPRKDANDHLKKNEREILLAALEDVRDSPLPELIKASDIEGKVYDRLQGQVVDSGCRCFFPSLPIHFRVHEWTLWFGYTSHGKALEINTPIPTTTGFRPIKEVHPGDWVYGPDGKPIQVVAESEIFTNHDCYVIRFSDGTEIIADAGHLWTLDCPQVRASKQRQVKRPRAKEGYDQRHKTVKPTIITTVDLASDLETWDQSRSKYSIDVADAYEGDKGLIPPIPPYTLGAWLGDGTSANGHISCHPDDSQIIERIKEDGYAVEKLKTRYDWSIRRFQPDLKHAGLLGNKHIPEIYFRLHKSRRLDLLRGLMDTDGTISNGRQCEFCSTSRQLAEGVQKLANGLGIKASLIKTRAILYGRDISAKFRVMFTTDQPVFHLQRKAGMIPKEIGINAKRRFVVSVTPTSSVLTKCLVVDSDDHLFLCGHACITTHNSVAVKNQVAYEASLGRLSLIASFEETVDQAYANLMLQITADPGIHNRKYRRDAFKFLSEQVRLYNCMKRVKPEKLLATFSAAHDQLGITTFVIDNVMTLDADRQDNTIQAETADAIRVFTATKPGHVHCVAHPRKQKDNAIAPPNISEVRGASEWVDMPHNVITVFRSTEKHEKIADMVNGQLNPDEIIAYDRSTPDGRFYVRKQRETGDMPVARFWFHKLTKRFMTEWGDPKPLWTPEPSSNE